MFRPSLLTTALCAVCLGVGVSDSVRAQQADSVAPTPSPEAIAAGQKLYQGQGGCTACHGENGVGAADGPSLVDGPWTQGDGSFAWLLHMTRHAGWGMRGRDGEPQRMRGPTTLDSAQVQRVTEYVYSISRAKPPATAPRTP
jgi:mono/diheme cytochrome c family protein